MRVREFMGHWRSALHAWASAWGGRADNPLARQAELTQLRLAQRGSPWACSWWLLSCGSLISAATAALLVQAVLRFEQLSASAVASSAYAHNVLLWCSVQVLDGLVLFGVAWLLARLAQAGWFCTQWLASSSTGRADCATDYSTSALSTEDYIVGAVTHTLRLCWAPCMFASAAGTVDQLCAVIALKQSTLAASSPLWPGGELTWLIIGALVGFGIRLLGSLASVLATLLLLLALSPYWRMSALAYLAPSAALLWHALAALYSPAGRRPWPADAASDFLALVFTAPQAVWLVGAGLLLLGVEAYAWRGPRTLQAHARLSLGSIRLLAAVGALWIIWMLAARFIDYDALYAHLSQAQATYPDLRSLAPGSLWPLQAISAAYGVPVLEQLAQGQDASALLTLKALGLRALALLMPLGLCAIFLGHLRTAVWLKRRGAL